MADRVVLAASRTGKGWCDEETPKTVARDKRCQDDNKCEFGKEKSESFLLTNLRKDERRTSISQGAVNREITCDLSLSASTQ